MRPRVILALVVALVLGVALVAFLVRRAAPTYDSDSHFLVVVPRWQHPATAVPLNAHFEDGPLDLPLVIGYPRDWLDSRESNQVVRAVTDPEGGADARAINVHMFDETITLRISVPKGMRALLSTSYDRVAAHDRNARVTVVQIWLAPVDHAIDAAALPETVDLNQFIPSSNEALVFKEGSLHRRE